MCISMAASYSCQQCHTYININMDIHSNVHVCLYVYKYTEPARPNQWCMFTAWLSDFRKLFNLLFATNITNLVQRIRCSRIWSSALDYAVLNLIINLVGFFISSIWIRLGRMFCTSKLSFPKKHIFVQNIFVYGFFESIIYQFHFTLICWKHQYSCDSGFIYCRSSFLNIFVSGFVESINMHQSLSSIFQFFFQLFWIVICWEYPVCLPLDFEFWDQHYWTISFLIFVWRSASSLLVRLVFLCDFWSSLSLFYCFSIFRFAATTSRNSFLDCGPLSSFLPSFLSLFFTFSTCSRCKSKFPSRNSFIFPF